jgi:hypothetical protein
MVTSQAHSKVVDDLAGAMKLEAYLFSFSPALYRHHLNYKMWIMLFAVNVVRFESANLVSSNLTKLQLASFTGIC